MLCAPRTSSTPPPANSFARASKIRTAGPRAPARNQAGMSCGICANRTVVAGINDITTTYPHIAAEMDAESTRINPPTTLGAGSGVKPRWVCPDCDHIYEMTVYNRTHGGGCEPCRKASARASRQNITVTHPEIAAQWHQPRTETNALRTTHTGRRKRSTGSAPPRPPTDTRHESNDEPPADTTAASAHAERSSSASTTSRPPSPCSLRNSTRTSTALKPPTISSPEMTCSGGNAPPATPHAKAFRTAASRKAAPTAHPKSESSRKTSSPNQPRRR